MLTLLAIPSRLYFWAAFLCYMIAFCYSWKTIHKEENTITPLFLSGVISGCILQILGLYIRSLEMHTFPIQNTFEITQLIVTCTLLGVLLLWPIQSLRIICFFITGLASILSIIGLNMHSWDLPYTVTSSIINPWAYIHVGLAVISFTLFGLTALLSFIYLLQDYGLSHKHYQGLFTLLPSLPKIQALVTYTLYVGVFMLILSTLLGYILHAHYLDFWLSPKALMGLSLVFMYSLLLVLNYTQTISPKYFSVICISCFIITFFCLWLLQPSSPSTHHAVQP